MQLEAIKALTKIGPDERAIPNLTKILKGNALPADRSDANTIQVSAINCLATLGPVGKEAAILSLRDEPSLLFRSNLSGETLRILPELTKLRKLHFFGAVVSDDGWAYVAATKSLRFLILTETKVSPTGLAHISRLPHLEELTLDEHSATDAGVEHLSQLKHLKTLRFDADLVSADVTDVAMKSIAKLRNLETLDLSHTKITDEGVKQLTKLSRLNHLDLTNKPITDIGLKYVGELTNLRFLSLRNTKVTDAGLKHLSKLDKLETLDVRYTPITKEGVNQLQARLPNLKQIQLGGEDAEARDGAIN